MPVLHDHKASEAIPPQAVRSDEQIVKDCINGKSEAWSELLEKYKNLIFSVPIKYGFSRDEAADVFQEVCLGLLSELQSVREPRALAKWLMTVTAHKCFHRRRQNNRVTSVEPEALETLAGDVPPQALQMIDEAEREQTLREAISALSGRCQQLVKMLFYETPSRPYRAIAQELGIAVGSIGFIRQRCLDKLRKSVVRFETAFDEGLAEEPEGDASVKLPNLSVRDPNGQEKL